MKKLLILTILSAILVGILPVSTQADSWYNSAWKNRNNITIDHTKVADDLSSYQMYIDLSSLGQRFWNGVNNGCGDVRITSSDGTTELAREIVSCDVTTKTGEIHTLIPTMSSSTDTLIYIYYGNPSASDYAPTDTYGSQAVWGANAKYIGHFNGNANDSSANAKNGTVTGAVQVAGKLDKAYSFDGINDKIVIGSEINSYNDGFVLSWWGKQYKPLANNTTYQAENNYGASTGIAEGIYWKGRQGTDTPGGTLFDYVIPNTDYGSQNVTIYCYQDSQLVVAGTWLIKDETTGATLASGDLTKHVIGDTDKRANDPYVFNGTGHPYHVYVYFSDTTDLYLDNVVFGRSGYDGLISKGNSGSSWGTNTNNAGSPRMYVNGVGTNYLNTVYVANTFERFVIVYDKTRVKAYKNGVLRADNAYTVTPNSNTDSIVIGEWVGKYYYWGEMSEVYVRNDPSAFSQSYITTEYNNQNAPSTFYSASNYVYPQRTLRILSGKFRILIGKLRIF